MAFIKCDFCRKGAYWKIASNAFQGAGKRVCREFNCWSAATGGYPAEGLVIKKK